MLRSTITGTGSYIPTEVKTNLDFTGQKFYTEDSRLINMEPAAIAEKLRQITGIVERRYAHEALKTSDMAAIAAREAVNNSGVDPETLDMIIVAQNFGDITTNTFQSDAVPALASKVKHLLKIKRPACIAYDILFGCPGWVQGLIQADAFFKAGIATKALIIGAETLSRVIDGYDRDSMIFSDGAGAVVMEYKEGGASESGLLSGVAVSHCLDELNYIYMGPSYAPDSNACVRYMKMKGRKVYEYALKFVPEAMKECFDKSGAGIAQLKKIFIHQANEKMDEAILQAFYKLYDYAEAPNDVMPMSIHYLGNSSVATIPTLYDLVMKEKEGGHSLQKGDTILFASVGAGMNINAVCYRI